MHCSDACSFRRRQNCVNDVVFTTKIAFTIWIFSTRSETNVRISKKMFQIDFFFQDKTKKCFEKYLNFESFEAVKIVRVWAVEFINWYCVHNIKIVWTWQRKQDFAMRISSTRSKSRLKCRTQKYIYISRLTEHRVLVKLDGNDFVTQLPGSEH